MTGTGGEFQRIEKVMTHKTKAQGRPHPAAEGEMSQLSTVQNSAQKNDAVLFQNIYAQNSSEASRIQGELSAGALRSHEEAMIAAQERYQTIMDIQRQLYAAYNEFMQMQQQPPTT